MNNLLMGLVGVWAVSDRKLSELLLQTPFERIRIAQGRKSTQTYLHAQCSRFVNGHFLSLRDADLGLFFTSIDQFFLGGLCTDVITQAGHQLTFRLGKRMTHCGGKTTTWTLPGLRHRKRFEIAISPRLVHESFAVQASVCVTGVTCHSPLEALTRIMEHEMLHLMEMALWNQSSCSRARFRSIAWRLFGHRESTHRLLTPAQLAYQNFQITTGNKVTFVFQKAHKTGVVQRIDRRATVLVPDPQGILYTDGRRYRKFYIPINQLRVTG